MAEIIDDPLNRRVDGLETDIKDLTRAVGGLESDMRNVASTLKIVNESVVNLSNKLTTESKTNWSVLAAWASFVIVSMSIVGNLALSPMVEKDRELIQSRRMIYERIHNMEKRHYEHSMEEGHAALSVKVKFLEKSIEEIKKEQQRRTDRVYSKGR